MFIRSFIYSLKTIFRSRTAVAWNLLFPIALGTMFYAAFSGLDEDSALNAIPVAIVSEQEDSEFLTVVSELSKEDDPLFDPVYVTEEEALELLENKEIIGILYDDSPVTLSVYSEMTSMLLEQSILNSFVEQYNINAEIIMDAIENHPEVLPTLIDELSAETAYGTEISYSDGNMSESLSYFFNLIAMNCLYGCLAGIQIAIHNQANLSTIAARKVVSSGKQFSRIFGEICSAITFQYICIGTSLLYQIFVLDIDFGSNFGYVALAALAGCVMGVSLGYFVGCFGKMGEGVKVGLCMAVSMICCFLSGLMAGNMRILVEQVCPWFNKINPAALISDSFYSLVVYESHSRYMTNIITLFGLSLLLCVGGVLIGRRNKYAAL